MTRPDTQPEKGPPRQERAIGLFERIDTASLKHIILKTPGFCSAESVADLLALDLQSTRDFLFAERENARQSLAAANDRIAKLEQHLAALSEGGCHDVVGDEYGNFPCPHRPRADRLAAEIAELKRQVEASARSVFECVEHVREVDAEFDKSEARIVELERDLHLLRDAVARVAMWDWTEKSSDDAAAAHHAMVRLAGVSEREDELIGFEEEIAALRAEIAALRAGGTKDDGLREAAEIVDKLRIVSMIYDDRYGFSQEITDAIRARLTPEITQPASEPLVDGKR